MVTTKTGADAEDQWYLDIGCSTHMTGHKDWFVSIDESVNHEVRFADDNTIRVEGHGKVVIKRKDGTMSYIEDVLYVPNMRCNLLSLGQLLEKKYRRKRRFMDLFSRAHSDSEDPSTPGV